MYIHIYICVCIYIYSERALGIITFICVYICVCIERAPWAWYHVSRFGMCIPVGVTRDCPARVHYSSTYTVHDEPTGASVSY